MSDIISKIQKLLNQANSTTHEAEADAFFAKAQELMVAHAISEEELASAGKSRTEEVMVVDVLIKEGQPATPARQAFLNTIAIANGCRSFIWKDASKMAVVGYESEAKFVQLLYLSAELQCRAAVVRASKEAKRHYEQEYYEPFRPGVFRRNFIEGYLARVGHRITQRYLKVDDSAGTGTSIVLRDRGSAAEAWMLSRFNLENTKKRKRNTAEDWEARGRGMSEAEHADISGGRGHLKNDRKEL